MSEKKVIFLSLFLALIAEAFLIFIIYFNPQKIAPLYNPSLQMTMNGVFNFCSGFALLIAFKFIKNKKIKLHIIWIHIALLSSAFFIVNYIIYHLSVGHVIYNNPNWRTLYLTILGTHLLASVICLPLIFVTYGLAIKGFKVGHKKIAKYTFFLWEYVSVTGVLLIFFLKFIHQA